MKTICFARNVITIKWLVNVMSVKKFLMRMERIELELPKFVIGGSKPMIVNFDWISVPKLMEADRILVIQKIRMVILWSCLVKPLTVNHNLTKVS